MLALPNYPGDGGGLIVDRAADAPRYEYASLNDCPQVHPDSPNEESTCQHALRDCPPEELGPLLRIWRRTVAGDVVLEPWDSKGLTCASDVAPGARPTLTMADLKAQFMRTPWAKPQVSSQPKGNITLVNLTTFYRVDWSTGGFAPGEVDQSVLRGIPVRIRPKLVGFTYVFGDGTTYGPTVSTGGVYPKGDITHVYRERGEFPTRVLTTFGADFSLDGTRWDPIPSTVTVPGPVTTITVREAQAVLVNH
ncbi:hypothetical protein N865_01645 [Intrasporangium oryzae NRRL B-24470]|uniref:PKD domain-containing protein n=1 Tax=Intrasporangium oryzae NRRL B-24470 TaxID=1386089 RepID=W9GAE0_9MICO|nr:hypothetical protein N865_01645 [Intrasporangium oryzae NRRL B-24470]